jgi:LacI family transcriptional regulator
MSSSPARRVTLQDIALHLKVSAMTVSRALRNDPRISPSRRDQVLRVASELHYRPDLMAVALAQKRTGRRSSGIRAELAWLNHWRDPARLLRYREFARVWAGAVDAAERLGFHLREFVVGERHPYGCLEETLRSRGIQGILVPPHGGAAVSAPDRTSLDWSRYAVVRIGYSVRDLPAHVVAGSQLQGGLKAFSQILARGYRRIGYVCPAPSPIFSRSGFLTCQVDLPAAQRVPVLFLADPSPEPDRRREQLRAWLHAHRPDAILTEIAGLATELAELGCRVPEDLGLAATTTLDCGVDAGIDQRSELVGQTAVETLVDLLQRGDLGLPMRPREVLVDSAWKEGASLPVRGEAAVEC